MTSYVLGFLFDTDKKFVLLITKARGTFSGTDRTQVDRINGIGGHIEAGEASGRVMECEFWRETGLVLFGWRRFGRLYGKEFEIYLFRNLAPLEVLAKAQKTTDEPPTVFRISDLEMNEAIIPNLRWMIPMALSFDRGEHAQHFDIQEG